MMVSMTEYDWVLAKIREWPADSRLALVQELAFD